MFRINDVFGGTYRILREIGHGGTGVVYLAYHLRLQKYVVIKRIRTDFEGVLSVRTEADILKNLHHPYLPQVYDFIQNGREVYTVMDYIEGQSLDVLLQHRSALPEKTLVRWLRQLLEVLEYLHSRRPPIVHSDIKPGNIMLTSRGDICLIDFNISLDSLSAGQVTGYSQFYAAPEQVQLARAKMENRPCSIRLDARTDLYSLAATFYTLMTGRYPLLNQPNTPLCRLAAGRYTPELLAILDRAMQMDPAKRYRSARRMLAAMDRLKRQDSRYRAYVALQALSWITAAVLLAGGLYCTVRGVRTSGEERYRADYTALSQAVQRGDDDAILEQGQALLNESAYRRVLEHNPGEYCTILHAVGDCYYNDENYAMAADYYCRALENAPQDDPSLELYSSDAAIAAALSGDTAQAEQILYQARQTGIADARQALIQSAIALRRAETDKCLQAVEEVLRTTEDSGLCAQACLLAAQATDTDTGRTIAWIEAADGYARSRQTLRRLGAAYMRRAEEQPARSDDDMRRALECYRTLCEYPYAPLEDRLNLAVVQLSCGQIADSIRTLNQLRREAPDDYRVEMNLAFAYDANGDTSSAAASCSRAWRLWKQTPATDRESEDSPAMQNLRQLQRQLEA